MLTEDLKEKIRSVYDAVKGQWPGFHARRGQSEMIGRIASVLSDARDAKSETRSAGENLLVVQAQTGVGKTIGYLVGSIPVAKALGKRIVISTGTVALQEQLVTRDIPALNAISPIPFSFALAKGRGRYACNIKLDSMAGQAVQSGMFEEGLWDRPPQPQEIALLNDLSSQLVSGEWNGERDSAPSGITDGLWSKVAAEQNTCLGKQCSKFNVCPYFNARKQLVAADVIVANHDLVMSALASQSKILPDPENTLYVFDEAHHLPHVALGHFARSHGLMAAIKWLEKLEAALIRASPLIPNGEMLLDQGETARKYLLEQVRALVQSLRQGGVVTREKPDYRFKHGVLSDAFTTMATEIQSAGLSLSDAVGALLDSISTERNTQNYQDELNKSIMEMGEFYSRARDFSELWEMMLDDTPDPPIAKWLTYKEFGGHSEYIVHASPISAARDLSNTLWSKVAGAVMTSATLKTLGEFDYFLRNSGLHWYPQTSTLEVASPFDYEHQGVFVVPKMSSCPSNDPEGHTTEISASIPIELSRFQHGVLVLFTSKKQMEAVYYTLPDEMLPEVLMQGAMPRAELITAHRSRVEAGFRSIIFGLQSFGEGLDLPGQYCEGVLITKLPFAPPDSPIEEARAEWLEKNNRNPFNEMSLPAVGLKMLQWSGRGIRTETDHARIVCFDKRLHTKSYGKKILSGLPPFRMEIAGKS